MPDTGDRGRGSSQSGSVNGVGRGSQHSVGMNAKGLRRDLQQQSSGGDWELDFSIPPGHDDEYFNKLTREYQSNHPQDQRSGSSNRRNAFDLFKKREERLKGRPGTLSGPEKKAEGMKQEDTINERGNAGGTGRAGTDGVDSKGIDFRRPSPAGPATRQNGAAAPAAQGQPRYEDVDPSLLGSHHIAQGSHGQNTAGASGTAELPGFKPGFGTHSGRPNSAELSRSGSVGSNSSSRHEGRHRSMPAGSNSSNVSDDGQPSKMVRKSFVSDIENDLNDLRSRLKEEKDREKMAKLNEQVNEKEKLLQIKRDEAATRIQRRFRERNAGKLREKGVPTNRWATRVKEGVETPRRGNDTSNHSSSSASGSAPSLMSRESKMDGSEKDEAATRILEEAATRIQRRFRERNAGKLREKGVPTNRWATRVKEGVETPRRENDTSNHSSSSPSGSAENGSSQTDPASSVDSVSLEQVDVSLLIRRRNAARTGKMKQSIVIKPTPSQAGSGQAQGPLNVGVPARPEGDAGFRRRVNTNAKSTPFDAVHEVGEDGSVVHDMSSKNSRRNKLLSMVTNKRKEAMEKMSRDELEEVQHEWASELEHLQKQGGNSARVPMLQEALKQLEPIKIQKTRQNALQKTSEEAEKRSKGMKRPTQENDRHSTPQSNPVHSKTASLTGHLPPLHEQRVIYDPEEQERLQKGVANQLHKDSRQEENPLGYLKKVYAQPFLYSNPPYITGTVYHPRSAKRQAKLSRRCQVNTGGD